ncbi:MAG: Smr/MutS family protein [Thauera sp.]|nr:Smr/MutS family protein [Thauera sp.]
MARSSRQRPHSGRAGPASPSAAAASAPKGFAALRARLQEHRQEQRAVQQTAAQQRSLAAQESRAEDEEQSRCAAEHALFMRSIGTVQPLRDRQQALIEAPRPAPVPRPRSAAESEEETGQPRQRMEDNPLLEAYRGVTPLRDSGRIEPAFPHRTRFSLPVSAEQDRRELGVRPAGLLLPTELDQLDPASLFQQLATGTRQLRPDGRAELAAPLPAPLPIQREQDERAALLEAMSTPISIEDRLDMGDEASFLRPGLPRRILTDLRRGRWSLQGELDLHGLVRDEARTAIALFIQQGLQQGWRCVRVIHGKGHGSPGKQSILKQLSRSWLAQREEILAFCQASPRDGGSGALYVLLRAAQAGRR